MPFLCFIKLRKKTEVKDDVFVQFLTHLNVTCSGKTDKGLVLVEAKGFSNHTSVGIPKLVPVYDLRNKIADGLLAFDFKIQTAEITKRKRLECDVKIILDLKILPENIKGIKVKASGNADIFLLPNE